MGKYLWVAIGVVVAGAVVALLVGQQRESSRAEQMAASLLLDAPAPSGASVDFASLSDLPPPVVRYFRHVLTDGQKLIQSARFRQVGVLRTSPTAERWAAFTASQLVVPPAIGFFWNARVETPLASHVRILDGYVAGVGAGRISLLSAFAVAADSGSPELNSGALHRYLAEAAWYPTALLPQSGVVWSPIDDRTAMATLNNEGTSVSLEFRFNDVGEMTGMYSPGRFSRSRDGYRLVPWEGRYQDYRSEAGMLIPSYGEVGWYENGVLELVWKGHVLDAHYELEP